MNTIQNQRDQAKKHRTNYKAEWIAKKRAEKRKTLNLGSLDISSDSSCAEVPPVYLKESHIENTISRETQEVVQQRAVHGNDDHDDGDANLLEQEHTSLFNSTLHEISRHSTSHFFGDTRTGSYLSSDGDETRLKLTETLPEELRNWAVTNHITHSSVDGLLEILRKHVQAKLPKCAKTLLQTSSTPVSVITRQVSGMQYVYMGIRNQLQKLHREHAIQTSTPTVELALNVDGLPLFKSSSTSFWVILGRVISMDNSSSSVFPICITLGDSKPKNLDFLQETITELIKLTTEGFETEQGKYKVKVNHIVCDAPAKSLVLATKLFSGYSACFDCTIRGQYVQHRIVYPEFENLQDRTDESFRNQTESQHHTGKSPFCQLPIDMITTFPIDYMHSCLLGVMKKLLMTWCVETKGSSKFPVGQIAAINDLLENIKHQTPTEFARRPRSISEVKRWKATEFRLFLLYTGKIVLKAMLPQDKYIHFLALSLAIQILLSPSLIDNLRDFAQELLEYFVSRCEMLYGPQFLVYNIHTLLHLSKQTLQFGVLDNCAAFPFENYMQVIKRSIRHGNAPLAQVSKRLQERQMLSPPTKPVNSGFRKFSTKPPNNIYLTTDDYPVELLKITYKEKDGGLQKMYVCRRFLQPKNYFTQPCPSKTLDIFKVDPSLTCLVRLAEEQMASKCFKIHCGNEVIIQKIIHT